MINLSIVLERVEGIEPSSSDWQPDVITTIRYPPSPAIAGFGGAKPDKNQRRMDGAEGESRTHYASLFRRTLYR